MEGKSYIHLARKLFNADFPIDNLQLLMLSPAGSDLENFLSSKYGKFAAEWDSNSTKLGFFQEVDGFFRKKTWILFKIGKGGKFAVECVSNDIIS